MTTTTAERITDLLIDHLGPDRVVGLESRLADDLGMDSLDRVEITMDIEEEFDLSLDDDQVCAVATVAELVALVERRLGHGMNGVPQ